MSSYLARSLSSGSIRRSSADFTVHPIGEVHVQYFVAPSDLNCSILTSLRPKARSVS